MGRDQSATVNSLQTTDCTHLVFERRPQSSRSARPVPWITQYEILSRRVTSTSLLDSTRCSDASEYNAPCVMSPPCIMKPGTTRWKRVFLYHSAFTFPLPLNSPAAVALTWSCKGSSRNGYQATMRDRQADRTSAEQAEVVRRDREFFVEELVAAAANRISC